MITNNFSQHNILLTLLFIALSLGSLNAMAMKKMQNNKTIDKNKINKILKEISESYNISNLFENNINKLNLYALIESLENISPKEKELNNYEQEEIIETLKTYEMKKIEEELKRPALSLDAMYAMKKMLENLNDANLTKNLDAIVSKKITETIKNDAQIKDLLKFAKSKKLGQDFTVKKVEKIGENNKKNPYSNMSTKDWNELGKTGS